MRTGVQTCGKKRPVNLTLNENLVARVRGLTDNLSGVVEGLLADYVQRAEQERTDREQALAATIAAWNDFNTQAGSFADEHSTL
mgnify:FL=1